MPGNAPVDATVQQVLKGAGDPWTMRNGDVVRTYDEVLLEGAARTCPVIVPVDVSLADGMQLRGWYNERSGSFKVAKDRPQNGGEPRSEAPSSGGGGRDDATGRSIERQVAAYAAAYMASALGGGETGGPVVLANFEQFFDTVIAKIQDADRPADDVPFS